MDNPTVLQSAANWVQTHWLPVLSVFAITIGAPLVWVVRAAIQRGSIKAGQEKTKKAEPAPPFQAVPATFADPNVVLAATVTAAPTQVHQQGSETGDRKWIECAYCGGTGSVTTFASLYQQHVGTCGICGGHGQILTDLWSQPACQRCEGSGRLVSREYQRFGRRGRYSTYTRSCAVCVGTGRRPR